MHAQTLDFSVGGGGIKKTKPKNSSLPASLAFPFLEKKRKKSNIGIDTDRSINKPTM